jgi:hypothetical protein
MRPKIEPPRWPRIYRHAKRLSLAEMIRLGSQPTQPEPEPPPPDLPLRLPHERLRVLVIPLPDPWAGECWVVRDTVSAGEELHRMSLEEAEILVPKWEAQLEHRRVTEAARTTVKRQARRATKTATAT